MDDKTTTLLPIKRPSNNPHFQSISNDLFILLGPISGMCIWLFVDDLDHGPPSRSQNMLAILSWVSIWWLTKEMQMPIASMSPLFPIFGICATTAFISMSMQNTAAAVMMMPVAIGIIHRLPKDGDSEVCQFSKAVVLGVIYSAAIGGMSTLTGTGANLILAGMWSSSFAGETPISFSTRLLFSFPLAVAMFFALLGVLCFMSLSRCLRRVLSAYLDKGSLQRELEIQGPADFAEKMILTLFMLLVALWMTRSITKELPGWGSLFHSLVGDGTVSAR